MSKKYWVPLGYVGATYLVRLLTGFIGEILFEQNVITGMDVMLITSIVNVTNSIIGLSIPVALLVILKNEFRVYKELRFYFVVTIIVNAVNTVLFAFYSYSGGGVEGGSLYGALEFRILMIVVPLIAYALFLVVYLVLIFRQDISRGLRNVVLARLIFSVITPVQIVFSTIIFDWFIQLYENVQDGIQLYGLMNMVSYSITILLTAGILYFVIRDTEEEPFSDLEMQLE